MPDKNEIRRYAQPYAIYENEHGAAFYLIGETDEYFWTAHMDDPESEVGLPKASFREAFTYVGRAAPAFQSPLLVDFACDGQDVSTGTPVQGLPAVGDTVVLPAKDGNLCVTYEVVRRVFFPAASTSVVLRKVSVFATQQGERNGYGVRSIEKLRKDAIRQNDVRAFETCMAALAGEEDAVELCAHATMANKARKRKRSKNAKR